MKFCPRVWLTVLTLLVGTESRNDPPFVDISFTRDIGVARVAFSDSGTYGVNMGRIGIFKKLWLLRCSRSVGERPLVRSILDGRPKKILELGLGELNRTPKILSLAAQASDGPIHYVGLDRFEARLPEDPAGVTLKEAHSCLQSFGRVQLVPGSPDSTLARLCNHLGWFDLILVSAAIDQATVSRCWFFLQRLTRSHTVVFQEIAEGAWEPVSHQNIDDRASQQALRKAG